ncbi:ImmA/IrrE family metallo-endopeptidase [Aerococcus urinae]|uniref:ImmA/IrrE family metallo-endopeptidase n=1 Tax=Aerococcus urinae TaxID=1376 RepID=UPI00254BFA72|nr:ImmA/IrrE family metallo-endopeptidase [Aerococcus urinae]MDK6689618.1 ImmA/IrrE family metallo-endopeptidase [Aerococcus urinae]HEO4250394.1 ImmA/IrrE family metallo-endopeptidase [Streptococcus agalactiae]
MSMNRYIYDKVNRLIKKYKTRDPIELIEALNINLVYLPKTEILLGMYHYIQRNRFIFISSNTNFNRKTILAHELGHDQLHRDYCMRGGAFHDQTVLNPTNKFETEANIFAAHLLISDEDVLDNINDQVCDYEIAGKLGVDINLLNLKISELAKMGKFNKPVNVNIPQGDFLKNYRPEHDDYY